METTKFGSSRLGKIPPVDADFPGFGYLQQSQVCHGSATAVLVPTKHQYRKYVVILESLSQHPVLWKFYDALEFLFLL